MVKDIGNSDSSNNDDLIFEENQLNLNTLIDLISRRKKIFTVLFLAFFSISTVNLIHRRINRPIYRGSFVLMITDPFINERKSSDGTFSLENLALNQSKSDIPTLIAYLKSPKLLENIAKKNNLPPSSLINKINIRMPSIWTEGRSMQPKTLVITIEGENKKTLKDITKKLSKEYVVAASNARKKQVSEGIKFLEVEQARLLEKVTETQKQLESFRLKNETLDPIREGELLQIEISKNEQKIISLKSENTRLGFISDDIDSGILFTEGFKNSLINQDKSDLGLISSDQLLLREILKVKETLAKAQSQYKSSSIVIENLKAKLKELKPALLEKQRSTIKGAITLNNSLLNSSKKNLYDLREAFNPYPRLITEYTVIRQALSNFEQNLLILIQTKDRLQLELSQEILPWKVINDPSVGGTPIKPDIKRNLVYLSFFAFLFSLTITYIVDKLNNVFHNTKEVEKLINFPILGFVPYFNFEPKDILQQKEFEKDDSINDLSKEENFFIFQETFRNIYTSIKFSNIDKEIKTISITSTVPEEGKSYSSLFLALNIAELSKKVLIIDTDLRRPTLHEKLKTDNITGLSNYLVKGESNWKDFISKHESNKNLSYMTAGKVPPNSVRLLESNKMREFIQDIKKNGEYDLIIFDCPPVLGLSDSLIVSNMVDGIVLNVSLNKVDRDLATESVKKLNTLNTPILGLIVNTVKKPKYENKDKDKYFTNYMPNETSKRYGMINTNNEKSNETNKQSTIKEKLSNILIEIQRWFYE